MLLQNKECSICPSLPGERVPRHKASSFTTWPDLKTTNVGRSRYEVIFVSWRAVHDM